MQLRELNPLLQEWNELIAHKEKQYKLVTRTNLAFRRGKGI